MPPKRFAAPPMVALLLLAAFVRGPLLCQENSAYWEIYDRSIGGLTAGGLFDADFSPVTDSDYDGFRREAKEFVAAWETWRLEYNSTVKANGPDPRRRQRELELWNIVKESARQLRVHPWAERNLTRNIDTGKERAEEPNRFHVAALDFTYTWYQWLSQHTSDRARHTIQATTHVGESVLWKDAISQFDTLAECREAQADTTAER